MSKLLELQYKILYRKGAENKLADALSKRLTVQSEQLMALQSVVQPTWMIQLVASYEGDDHANELLAHLSIDKSVIISQRQVVCWYQG